MIWRVANSIFKMLSSTHTLSQ